MAKNGVSICREKKGITRSGASTSSIFWNERPISACSDSHAISAMVESWRGRHPQAARADYQDAARVRQIEATLPKAWRELIESQDSILVELIADKVEDMCGYKPDLDTCSRFLGQSTSGGQVLARTRSVSNASGASTLRAPNRPPSASQATTKTGSLLRAYFMALAQQEKSCRKFFDSLRNATAHSWSDSPLGNMARSDVLSLETELSSTQEDQIFPNIPSN